MKLRTWLAFLTALVFCLGGACVAAGVAIIQRDSSLERTLEELLDQSRMLSPADLGNHRIDIRVFMINSHLAQAKDPVVIIGDSITEAAFLPATVCGHPVVNAGIGSATPQNYIKIIKEKGLLADMNAALVLVALGTNNAHASMSPSEFDASYRELIGFLGEHTRQTLLVSVPSIGAGDVGQFFNADLVPKINTIIGTIAGQKNLLVITLPDQVDTLDGVHPSPVGYKHWITAIDNGAKAALKCGATASAD